MKQSARWKILTSVLGVIAYFGLLGYISSIQNNYNVVLQSEQDTYEFPINAVESYEIPIEVTNKSNKLICSSQNNEYLSYHVYDSEGNVILFDNIRTPFAETLFNGDKKRETLMVSPLSGGDYYIEVDIVEEGVSWYSEKGNAMLRIDLRIQ